MSTTWYAYRCISKIIHKVGAKRSHVNVVESVNLKMIMITRVECIVFEHTRVEKFKYAIYV